MNLFPLDSISQNALMMLCKHPSGLPFEELGIDEQTFLFLLSNDFVSEPQGKVIEPGFSSRFCVHEGNVIIEPIGKNYVEKMIQDSRSEKQKNIKYWITTGIAIIALIKSFVPEISLLLVGLLKAIKQ